MASLKKKSKVILVKWESGICKICIYINIWAILSEAHIKHWKHEIWAKTT